MLDKDQTKRAKLDDILKSEWVTNNGKEVIEPNDVVRDMEAYNQSFSNIDRIIKSKALG